MTEFLCKLAKEEKMYAYDYIGKRYNVGSKIGFLQAMVDFALEREGLKKEFKEYLKSIME